MFEITNKQVQALRQIQDTIHQSCKAAGLYTDLETGQPIQRNFGEVLALAVIRILDTAGAEGLDEVKQLREWQEKAFDAHPNIDMDIERLAP